MSYLDVPRIHVFGRFFTDPSSINNDPTHYDPDCTRPAPWQEPSGLHRFQLVDCAVTSAMTPSGPPSSDPVIGAAVQSVDAVQGFPNQSAAKLVDLDVYQQNVPTIFGLRLQILDAAGAPLLAGIMDPAILNGVWFTAVLPTRGWNVQYGWGSYGGDYNACGSFQSILRVPESSWPTGISAVLDQHRAASDVATGPDGMTYRLVSIKFVLDGYNNVQGASNYRYGRFTGTLGPARANEPAAVPAGNRWLLARPLPATADWYVPAFYGASFVVDATRKKLVFDLANSVCRMLPGGDPVDLGTLNAVIPAADATQDPAVLGPVVFNAFTYSNTAGIAEVQLTDAQVALVAKNPVALMTSRQDIGAQQLFAEDPSGLACAVDLRVLRMTSEPDGPATTAASRAYFTQWGAPAKGVQWALSVQTLLGNSPNVTVPPTNPGDGFDAEGALVGTIDPSDQYGFAAIRLRAVKDPGSRTSQLDGQMYSVYPFNPTGAGPSYALETLLAVHVYSSYAVWPVPTTEEDGMLLWSEIRSMMTPYAKLYPGMTDKIDLTDLHTFTIFADNPPWGPVYHTPQGYQVDGISAGAIPFYLTRDMNDPRLMPVTRDLSPNRLQTVLNFVKWLRSNAKPPPPPSGTPS